MSESDAKWYVVHTYSGYENKVATDLSKMVENRQLQELIYDIQVPTETVVEIGKDNQKKEVERKIFPGYVLIKMIVTDDSWYVVRNTRGVTGFVGPASKPVPLTEEEVASLGVNIVDGPLDGFSGIVDKISPEENQVTVTISMFGRETPVELELDQVELIG